MVEDDGAFRFTAFFKGEFVRQIGLPMQELRATRMYALDALGATTEGDILLAGRPSAVSSSADAWGRAALVVMDRFGERFDTVAMYDAVPPASLEWGSFRPLGSVAVTGDRIVLARNDRPEVRWLDFEGELRQITRWNDDPVPLTEAFRAEYREFLLEQSTADEVDEAIRALEGPLRYFTNVIGDREGNVWLRSYESLYRDPGRYLVISAEGDWIGSVRIPRGFKILDIGSDRILVMERNEVDVGAVAVYDLVKSQVESER